MAITTTEPANDTTWIVGTYINSAGPQTFDVIVRDDYTAKADGHGDAHWYSAVDGRENDEPETWEQVRERAEGLYAIGDRVA